MNRRGFLAALAGAALDPERALWVPGRKLISTPAPPTLSIEFIIREALRILHDDLALARALRLNNTEPGLQLSLAAAARFEQHIYSSFEQRWRLSRDAVDQARSAVLLRHGLGADAAARVVAPLEHQLFVARDALMRVMGATALSRDAVDQAQSASAFAGLVGLYSYSTDSWPPALKSEKDS